MDLRVSGKNNGMEASITTIKFCLPQVDKPNNIPEIVKPETTKNILFRHLP
jgi:hypothetical protein